MCVALLVWCCDWLEVDGRFSQPALSDRPASARPPSARESGGQSGSARRKGSAGTGASNNSQDSVRTRFAPKPKKGHWSGKGHRRGKQKKGSGGSSEAVTIVLTPLQPPSSTVPPILARLGPPAAQEQSDVSALANTFAHASRTNSRDHQHPHTSPINRQPSWKTKRNNSHGNKHGRSHQKPLASHSNAIGGPPRPQPSNRLRAATSPTFFNQPTVSSPQPLSLHSSARTKPSQPQHHHPRNPDFNLPKDIRDSIFAAKRRAAKAQSASTSTDPTNHASNSDNSPLDLGRAEFMRLMRESGYDSAHGGPSHFKIITREDLLFGPDDYYRDDYYGQDGDDVEPYAFDAHDLPQDEEYMETDARSEFSNEEYNVEDYSAGDESDFVGQGGDTSDEFAGEVFHTIGTDGHIHLEDPYDKDDLDADDMDVEMEGDGGASRRSSASGSGSGSSLHGDEEDDDEEDFSFLADEIESALDNLGIMSAGSRFDTRARDSGADNEGVSLQVQQPTQAGLNRPKEVMMQLLGQDGRPLSSSGSRTSP
ncbi:hypothetical protein BC830DRAFT_689767 [Chytriomyces sp. MP71]|nr:hypothetical protein BC830DRAFT_689767 [Chytriomyces sp. MP71]